MYKYANLSDFCRECTDITGYIENLVKKESKLLPVYARIKTDRDGKGYFTG